MKFNAHDERGIVRLILGIGALAVFFIGMLVVIVALTFSVQVSGDSMQPTLHPGDRLEVNVFAKHDVNRFDVVEAIEPDTGDSTPGSGTRIVKRAIGMPGDQIAIEGGEHPVVLIRPAGEKATYRVDNPAWVGQIGSNTTACCSAKLTGSDKKQWRTIPSDSYFLMGDNWGGSTDSRVFGPIAQDKIEAKLSFRILPRGRFGSIANDVKLVRVTP